MTYTIPQNSILVHPGKNYADSFSIRVKAASLDILPVTKAIFLTMPIWIRRLMTFRNILVAKIGLKTGERVRNPEEVINRFDGQVGSAIGLFEVLDRADDEIIFGQSDSHLDFKASILLLQQQVGDYEIHFTTTVQFHNAIGRIYFFFVKPFHKVIVKSMLKSAARSCTR